MAESVRPSSAEVLLLALDLLAEAVAVVTPQARVDALRARVEVLDPETAMRVATALADMSVRLVGEARRSPGLSLSAMLERWRLEAEFAASPGVEP